MRILDGIEAKLETNSRCNSVDFSPVVAVSVWASEKDPSPSYGGRSLYQWLELLERDEPEQIEQYWAATNAIQTLGAEAVPYLANIIAPEPKEQCIVKEAWSEVSGFLLDYFDDIPSFDGGEGPSSYRAAAALTLIEPEGIVCLTNLLAQNHHLAGWGLVQNSKSRNWPGVQELLIVMAGETDELDGVYGTQYVWNLSRYQGEGKLDRLIPLGTDYVTNSSRWRYEERLLAGAWLLASLVKDAEHRTNLYHAIGERKNPAYSNAVHQVLRYHSVSNIQVFVPSVRSGVGIN